MQTIQSAMMCAPRMFQGDSSAMMDARIMVKENQDWQLSGKLYSVYYEKTKSSHILTSLKGRK